MRFPTTCYDNFYEDPESVVDFALALDYTVDEAKYPGCRTSNLFEIDPDFANASLFKMLSLFDDFNEEGIDIDCKTHFHKTWRFSPEKEHILNKGWIHKDDGILLAAIVYLSKNSHPDSGTSIYSKRIGEPLPDYSRNYNSFDQILGGSKETSIDAIKEYETSLIENNEPYDVQIEVKNAYNRLICYDGEQHHTHTSCWRDDEDFRLTQLFFIDDIKCFSKKIPSIRCNRYGI